jgi:hypothetical protein
MPLAARTFLYISINDCSVEISLPHRGLPDHFWPHSACGLSPKALASELVASSRREPLGLFMILLKRVHVVVLLASSTMKAPHYVIFCSLLLTSLLCCLNKRGGTEK